MLERGFWENSRNGRGGSAVMKLFPRMIMFINISSGNMNFLLTIQSSWIPNDLYKRLIKNKSSKVNN